MSDLLISGGTVIPVTKEGCLYDPGEVAIRGNEILYVGSPGGNLPQDWQPQRIIRAEGKLILPGFINSHTHAAMSLFRGYGDDLPLQEWLEKKIWPVEKRLTPDAVYWGTMLAIAEMLLAGVTTFADMYFFPEAIAQAVADTGIRASIALGLLGVQSDSAANLERAIRFCSEWDGGASGRITTMLGPHAPYTCPPKFLQRVLDAARKLGVGVHIHLAETEAEVGDIKKEYGLSPIAYFFAQEPGDLHILAAHCVHVDELDMNMLAAGKVHVSHNPGSNLKLASGIAPIPQLLAKGVPVALGTDGASSNNNLDLLEEARLAALIHKGYSGQPTVIPARKALEMATVNGAAALGLAGQCGSLKAGMRADIILMDREKPHMYPAINPLSALIYSARSSDVDMVIVDGQILVEGGQLCKLDLEKIMVTAEKHSKKLFTS